MLSKLKRYFSENKALFLLSLLFFIVQIVFLDQAFLLRGERDITFTGYSLAKTGRDLYGNLMPLEFTGLDMPTPFLAFYYSALWWLLVPIRSVFFARLPYVIASLSLVFLIAEIVFEITKEKRIAFLTAVVFCFSPGVFHLTRLSLEIGLAMPLLLAGILLYLKNKKLVSYIPFLLSFFTYNGFRPLIPFLLIYLESYFYFKNRDFKEFLQQNILNILFFVFLFTLSFNVIDGQMMSSRKKDLIFLSYDKIEPLVIFRRNTAIGPLLLKSVMNNKITSTIYYIIEVFVKGQDISYLFLKGDSAAIYATTFTGQFFLICLPFYYLGLVFFGKKWSWNYFFLIGLIPIALIPSLINIDYVSVAIRSMPASIGYAYVIAGGLCLFLNLIKRIKLGCRLSFFLIIASFLAIELSYFSYNYYLRRPKTMFEMFFESERQLAEYLINKKRPYIIYDDSPKNVLEAYLFLNRPVDMGRAQEQFGKGLPYKYDGMKFLQCPSSPTELTIKPGTIVADSCTDLVHYQKLSEDPRAEKIDFKDFSQRIAYFVFN
jgi:hypothetical protein